MSDKRSRTGIKKKVDGRYTNSLGRYLEIWDNLEYGENTVENFNEIFDDYLPYPDNYMVEIGLPYTYNGRDITVFDERSEEVAKQRHLFFRLRNGFTGYKIWEVHDTKTGNKYYHSNADDLRAELGGTDGGYGSRAGGGHFIADLVRLTKLGKKVNGRYKVYENKEMANEFRAHLAKKYGRYTSGYKKVTPD